MGVRSTQAKVAIALVVAIGLAGCRTKGEKIEDANDTTFAEDGTDTSAAESDAQLLTSSLISSGPNGTVGLASVDLSGSELATRTFGDGARAIYLPRGCLTVEHDAATRTATYTFDHCLGPYGLRAVTGQVKGAYTVEADHLHLDLTADDLQVNDAKLDWSASADVLSTDTERTMTWKAQLSGTSAGGRTFARTSEHTVTWRLGEPCFSLTGSSQGEIRKSGETEGREIRAEISNFRRCRRGCPDAGGKIVITNVSKNKRVELTFDGTNHATFVAPNGATKTVALLCRP